MSVLQILGRSLQDLVCVGGGGGGGGVAARAATLMDATDYAFFLFVLAFQYFVMRPMLVALKRLT